MECIEDALDLPNHPGEPLASHQSPIPIPRSSIPQFQSHLLSHREITTTFVLSRPRPGRRRLNFSDCIHDNRKKHGERCVLISKKGPL